MVKRVMVAVVVWAMLAGLASGQTAGQTTGQTTGQATSQTPDGMPAQQGGAAAPAQKGQPPAGQPAKPVEGRRYAVVIEHKGVDELGLRLVYNMREKFNTSSFFRQPAGKERKLRLRVSTAEEFRDRPYIGSVYAVVWLFSESDEVLSYYLDSEVGVAGPQGLAELAERLAARTQGVAAQFNYLFE